MRLLNTILLSVAIVVMTLICIPLALVQFAWEWASFKVKR